MKMNKTAGCILAGTLVAALTADAQWWRGGRKDQHEQKEEDCGLEYRTTREVRGPHGDIRTRIQIPEEQIERMREERDAIRSMAEAYRDETDPAKQEEIKKKLREHLADIADRMEQAHQRRLDTVREEVNRLEKRAEQARAQREQRIEDQLERILSGEPLVPFGDRDGPARRPRPGARE